MALDVYTAVAPHGGVRDKVSAPVNAGASYTVPDPGVGDNNTIALNLNTSPCVLRLPGSTGHVTFVNGSRTQTGVASITGDIDVRVKVTVADTTGGSQTLVGKDGAVPGHGWYLQFVSSTGKLSFIWSPDGTNLLTRNSTVTIPAAFTVTTWLRAYLDVDNGASGHTVTFFTSLDGSAWTTLGAPVITAGVTNIYNNVGVDYILGRTGVAAAPFVGDLHYVDVRSSFNGTTVLPTDPNDWVTSVGGTQTAFPAITPPAQGTSLKLALTQSGGLRVVSWPGNVKWPGGIASALTSLAGATDYFQADFMDGVSWSIQPLVQDGTPTARVEIKKFANSLSYHKPAWATSVQVIAFAGGGGGGAGRRGAPGSIRCGGGGGAGGGRIDHTYDAADVPPLAGVTVGAGGIGGVSQVTDSTDGASGSVGSNSAFHLSTAPGGGPGAGGQSGAGGVGGNATPASFTGGAGGSASATGGAGAASTVLGNGGAQGGGAGGGVSAADAASAGGGAYTSAESPTFTLVAGGAIGVAGTVQADRLPLLMPAAGTGGPGGGAHQAAVAGAGAAGAKYGGGGGGGGASANTFASGAGGAGAPGFVWVISRG